MKSPHLLSSECDLAICTRSAQTSHKDFVVTTQTVVSQRSADLPFYADRLIRAAVHTILADLMPAGRTNRNMVSRCPVFEYPPFSVRAHLNCERRHTAFSSVTFRQLKSTETGFANSPPDKTIRIATTIPTQIQNQQLVSCSFLAFQINTRQSFAASATVATVIATTHEFQSIGGGCSFQK